MSALQNHRMVWVERDLKYLLELDTGSPSTEIGTSWIAPFFFLSFLIFRLIWVFFPAQAMSGLTFAICLCCFSLMNWQGNRDQPNHEYLGVLLRGIDPTIGTGNRGCTGVQDDRDRHWDTSTHSRTSSQPLSPTQPELHIPGCSLSSLSTGVARNSKVSALTTHSRE